MTEGYLNTHILSLLTHKMPIGLLSLITVCVCLCVVKVHSAKADISTTLQNALQTCINLNKIHNDDRSADCEIRPRQSKTTISCQSSVIQRPLVLGSIRVSRCELTWMVSTSWTSSWISFTRRWYFCCGVSFTPQPSPSWTRVRVQRHALNVTQNTKLLVKDSWL